MRSRTLTLLFLLAVPWPAAAEGFSADVELLRPTFSPSTPLGVESPVLAGAGAMRFGVMYQYERDPVILLLYGEEAGSVIQNRRALTLGYAYDVNSRFSVRGVLPLSYQSGTDQRDFAYEGPGLGDLEAGGRVVLLNSEYVDVGLRGDLMFPIGTNNAYLGEEGLRVRAGAMGLGHLGPAQLALDASFVARPTTDSGVDYVNESTVELNTGASIDLWPDKVSINAAYLARWGANHIGQPGGENASELVGGLRFALPGRDDQVDLGVGKGIAQGVGSTSFRWFVAYTYVRPPKPVPAPPTVVVTEQPEPDPIVPDIFEPEEPEVVVWEEHELAKVVEDQIVIRDPIQFEFNSDKILPESLPTLQAVATILNDNAQIGHIVIEGHASEEGSYEYNYDLSNLRARSIWKELIRSGVHPSRLSYRGMGEVNPVTQGSDEASLAQNRRVIFHIVEQYSVEGPFPVYPETIPLPWNGEVVKTVQPKEPPKPEKPEEKTVEQTLDELLNPNNFRIEDDPDEDEAPTPPPGEKTPNPSPPDGR